MTLCGHTTTPSPVVPLEGPGQLLLLPAPVSPNPCRRNEPVSKRTRVPDGANPALPCIIDECTKPRKAKGWCAMHYTRWQVHGDPHHVTEEWRRQPKPSCAVPAARRFWSKVDLSNPDGCWPWAGAMKHRYGEFWMGTGKVYAHRMAATLVFGELDPDDVVMHVCDNPACVRPDHLRIGTQTDNMRDCGDKGRWRNQHAIGPNHPEVAG